MVYPWWSRTKALITCLLHPSRDQQRFPSPLCVCIHVWSLADALVHVCTFGYIYVPVEARNEPRVLLRISSSLILETESLTCTWNSPILLDWLTSNSHEPTYPPSQNWVFMCHHAWFVLNKSSGDYTTPHVCAASTFPTEPPPQLNRGLIFTCYFSTINFCKPGHGLCLLGL